MSCGIYTITNIKNNKIYVGYSLDIEKRIKYHKQDLIGNRHANILLQRLYNMYGMDILLFEILEEYDKDFLPSFEHYWCMILSTHDRRYGYNLSATSPISGVGGPSEESIKLGIKTRHENAEKRGYWHSEETKANISKNRKGISIPKEAIERAASKMRGRKLSPEHVVKMVSSRKKKGYKHSPETILKIKTANINHKYVITEKMIDSWKIHEKKVYQFTKNMEFIKEYRSAKIAEEETGISRNSICYSCLYNQKNKLKKCRTIKNFIWKYELY